MNIPASRPAYPLDNDILLQGILDHTPAFIYIKDLQSRYILTSRMSELVFNIKNEDIQGKTPHEVLPKEIADIFEGHDQVVVATDSVQEFEETFCRPGHPPFTLLTVLFPLRRATGESYAVCGISTDITARKQAEFAEHEQRTLAEALADTAATLNSTLDINEVLDRILTNVERVVPHDAAAILLVGEDRKTAHVARHKKRPGTGEVQPLLSAQIPLEDMHRTNDLPLWMKAKGMEWVRSIAGAPIVFDDQLIGYIYLMSAAPNFFQPAQIERLRAFANQASIAIRNARLYEQAQELAAFKERQRLAREMHDAVSQSLFSATVMAETLPRIWNRSPETVKEGLVELQKLTRGALAEMRNLLVELRPKALINADLGDLIRQLADGLAGRTQVVVELKLEGRRPLPAEVQTAFFRIAQETLNNIVKHARASRVLIAFNNQPQRVSLFIRDNGCGFDIEAVPPDRLGLKILQERAAAIGAVLEINSQLGEGTTLGLHWENPQSQVVL
ncbi:MAG: PAS domain-containing protein [Anaerolineaceae bacterium]|nr:PAS domain-containing protein [Anaerolineaceae bacterium]